MEIPNAKQSPRIENGIIKWYEGDTFDLDLVLELSDQDGESVSIAAASTVTVELRDKTETAVKTFSFTGIANNTVTLTFDSVCTALFPKGEYHYRVWYSAGERTTLAADDLCVVE